jgi:WhiB family redox-sensing transcriptional regulator
MDEDFWDSLATLSDTATEPWAASALCSQVYPDTWFPDKGDSTREAKKVCMACPVRAECEDYVRRRYELGYHEHGVWAGMSREQRKMRFDRANERVSTRNVQQDAEILSMQGVMSARDIAKTLGISRRSVERVFNRAKEAA